MVKKYFFLGCLALGATAQAATNKTFMSARLHTTNAAVDMLQNALKYDQLEEKNHPYLRLQYEQSLDPKPLGRYFGMNDKHEMTFGHSVVPTSDVGRFLFIHTDDDRATPQDTLTLKPSYHSTMLQTGYILRPFGDESNFLLGFSVSAADVSHKLNPSFSVQQNDALKKFFYGEYADLTRVRLQTSLQKAKFHNGRKAVGLADVRVVALKKHEISDECGAVYGFQAILPTGRKQTGEFLFDAHTGNGRHLGIGYLFAADYELKKEKEISYHLAGYIDYTYLFANRQMRTLGIGGKNYGHYYLFIKRKGALALLTPLTEEILTEHSLVPAANLLTQSVSVIPGSQYKGGVTLSARMKKGTVSFGYGFDFAQEEKIRIKNKWSEEQYAIADGGLQTTQAFDATGANPPASLRAGDWVNSKDLDPAAAAIATRFNHTVSGNVSLVKQVRSLTYVFDVGMMYQFATQNAKSSSLVVTAAFSGSF